MGSTNWLIGNGISLAAAVFTAKSSWARERRKIYGYQIVQCLLLALASVFFGSYAGIVSLLVCALRNYLAAVNQLDGKMTALCLALIVIPGLLVNNNGWIGLLLLATNAGYTLGMFLCTGERAIKWNILVNLFLWIVYECWIGDLPSIVADGIGFMTAAISLVVNRKKSVNNP